MTVGQRIAQKRKELGLSQEVLGERLGVSRQAIYKWESDAALPEIEKLVNLSREFSASVGWLLGEEDDVPEKPELTPEQLRMVEEIVGRYLAAQPAEKTIILRETVEAEPGDGRVQAREPGKRKRRWPWVLAGLALAGLFFNLFSRLDQMSREYRNLQNSISYITTSVNSQINGIASRVEEILQSQNLLTAEQSAEVTAADYRANTVTVSARAMPRTYVEGMTAEFILVSDGETVTVPGELGEGHVFMAEAAIPLSDDITVSVALVTQGKRETQVVEQFRGLYETSLPVVVFHSGPWCRKGEEQRWMAQDWAQLSVYAERDRGTEVASIRLGLFQDGKRVAWYEEAQTEPANGASGQDRTIYFSLEEEIPLEVGASYALAALVTDEYGREWVVAGETYIIEDLETAITPRETDLSKLTF